MKAVLLLQYYHIIPTGGLMSLMMSDAFTVSHHAGPSRLQEIHGRFFGGKSENIG